MDDNNQVVDESRIVEMAQFAEEASPVERAVVQAYINGLKAGAELKRLKESA